jgi:hypothetical protein
MGINKLADMFMGNPQPLEAKVEQAQKQTPPGKIPPDLAEALALQQIQEAHQHAQNQQAMQAGGPQQTVMDKLRQLTGTVAQAAPGTPPQMAQAQPPMPMVQAAHGGSIAHLASNLGQHYGGGGIVAFAEGDQVPRAEEKTEEERKAERRKADRESLVAVPKYLYEKLLYGPAAGAANVLGATASGVQNFGGRIANALAGSDVVRTDADYNPRIPLSLSNEAAPAAAPAPVERGRPTMPNEAALRSPSVTQAAPVAAPPPAARPAGNAGLASIQPAGPAPTDLKSILREDIANTLKRDPDKERDKGAEYYRKTVGLDALLAEQEARAAAREARYEKAKEDRTPDWVRGLQAAGGPAVRGGLGMLLGQVGRGATASRDENAAADAKFADEQDRLRDIITKAKIEGNTGVANAGIKALEQLRMDHQNARTSGTSLLNTEELTAQRREQARQHNQTMAANRATAADQRNMSNAINAIKADPIIDKLLKDAEALSKMPTAANQAKAAMVGQQIEARQNAIYKQFGVLQGGGTMGAAPGAGSPSGTTTSGWGKAQVVK